MNFSELHGKLVADMAKELEAPFFLFEHPADTFDRLTALGYKLNLITGEYERI